MAANVIVFDSQYTNSQIKNLDSAQGLIDQALGELKRASLQDRRQQGQPGRGAHRGGIRRGPAAVRRPGRTRRESGDRLVRRVEEQGWLYSIKL